MAACSDIKEIGLELQDFNTILEKNHIIKENIGESIK